MSTVDHRFNVASPYRYSFSYVFDLRAGIRSTQRCVWCIELLGDQQSKITVDFGRQGETLDFWRAL
jgi:hypothetical protein